MTRFNVLIPLCIFCFLGTACTSRTPTPVDCQQPLPLKTSKSEQAPLNPSDKHKHQSIGSRSNAKLAAVETMKINMPESVPVQVNIDVTGSLPSACYHVGEIHKTRDNNHFSVIINLQALQTYLPCAEIPVPFSTSVALNVQGLEAGGYCVTVNDITDSFVLNADN